MPARLKAIKSSGGVCEILYLDNIDEFRCEAYIKGKLKANDILAISDDIALKVCKLRDDGVRVVEFYDKGLLQDRHLIYKILKKYGKTPLPPYIQKQRSKLKDIKIDESKDAKDYQSLFAKIEGSVAAPTASLHFTEQLLNKLKSQFSTFYTTLHIGAGTFKPIECENVLEHKMHSEKYSIDTKTIELINTNKKILCIGTTATRSIETYMQTKKEYGISEIFLHPHNKPKRVDYLLTNFHMPKSTLLLLVASFVGKSELERIYKEAIKNDYRFFSYGDSMLII